MKGTIYLAKKIVNAKITSKRIGYGLLILFVCFVLYVVILNILWEIQQPDLVEQWKEEVWRKAPEYDLNAVDEWLEQQGNNEP